MTRNHPLADVGNKHLIARLIGTTSVITLLMIDPAAAERRDAAPAGGRAVAQVAQAAAADLRSFQIPAQPLSAALTAFGQQSGFQVSFNPATVGNTQSSGVTGSFTPLDALRRITAGTGTSFRVLDARTVTVERATVGGGGDVTVLGPVTVDATTEAGGVVRGYVAKQSTAGTKSGTPIIETPQAISVVTRDQMDAQAIQNVPQALRYTAGVASEPRGASQSGYEKWLYARGFALDEYLDGLKLLSGEFGAPQVDPFFLERLEVLHGPASVLYGQASPGGLANLVSKRPTDTPYHAVTAEVGNNSRYQGSFDLSGPVDKEGRLLYRLSGFGRTADTQVDHTKEQRLAIAPSVTWKPTDKTTLTVLGSYQYDPKAGFEGYVPARGSVLPNPAGEISTSFFSGDPSYDRFFRRQYSIGYLFEHRFDETWTVRQNARYNHVDAKQEGVWPLFLTDNRTLRRYSFRDSEHNDAVSLDNQVEAKFTTGPAKHTVVVGVDYQHYMWNQIAATNFAAPTIDIFNPTYGQSIPAPNVNYDTRQRLSQIGFYAQDQIRIDNWALLFGGRFDRADRHIDDHLADTRLNQSDKAFSGRAGLVYLFDNGLAPYASYTTSFNPTSATDAGVDAGGNPFKPTKGEQVEVGVKFQPKGVNSFVTLSVFNLKQKDVLTTDPNPAHVCSGGACQIQNGEVRSRGVELSGKASLSEGLDLTAAFSYLDNVVTKADAADGTKDKHPASVPAYLASLWGSYRFLDGDARGLGLSAGVRHVGSSWGDGTNSFKVPSYTLVDAGVSYDLGALKDDLAGMQASVNATNLFDKSYVASCANATRCYYGLRRTVMGRLKYEW